MPKLTLKQARLISGLTQKQLAEKIGVHTTTIAAWEKEPSKVSISNAIKIAELLDMSISIFLNNNST